MPSRPPHKGHGRRTLRCAIYTRKSSEEGLGQDFNSLDAQRDACEAFIASQKHEGWLLLPQMYDDGGFSGATMDRPAFQRLLADVTAGEIDVVVVYKVDRLTRSLSDFAKVVDIFDKRSVSFVSVTQQFNTTTSMGRLTLNVLLSFAQFEREVTGERIRDKIAASKKKGMWMGGLPPLGYDVKDRRLVVSDSEADTVRHIFRRYVELKSVRSLKADLDAVGIVSKARIAADGSQYGRKPFARGALYHMLQNRIYRGEIAHKDKSYQGDHPAIVDEALWSEAQAVLTGNRIDRAIGAGDRQTSLLSGILFDAQGKRMTPTHASKKGVRYRYYVSSPLLSGTAKTSGGQRIPTAALDTLVAHRIRDWLAEPVEMLNALIGTSDAAHQSRLIERAKHYAATWHEFRAEDIRALILSVVARIQAHADRIEVAIDQHALARLLDDDHDLAESVTASRSNAHRELLTLIIPARLKRAGQEMKIVLEDGSQPASPDASLVRVIVRGHAIRDRLLRDKSLTLEEIAKSEGMVASYATRLLRLTVLAPDIVAAILSGNHPPELTARRLMDDTRLPLDWSEQRRGLGFALAQKAIK